MRYLMLTSTQQRTWHNRHLVTLCYRKSYITLNIRRAFQICRITDIDKKESLTNVEIIPLPVLRYFMLRPLVFVRYSLVFTCFSFFISIELVTKRNRYICVSILFDVPDDRYRILVNAAGFFCRSQVTGHRSQVIVLPIQKVSQTLLKANLKPKNVCLGLIRPTVSFYKFITSLAFYKLLQTLLKANLQPKNVCLGLIRPTVSFNKCLGYFLYW